MVSFITPTVNSEWVLLEVSAAATRWQNFPLNSEHGKASLSHCVVLKPWEKKQQQHGRSSSWLRYRKLDLESLCCTSQVLLSSLIDRLWWSEGKQRNESTWRAIHLHFPSLRGFTAVLHPFLVRAANRDFLVIVIRDEETSYYQIGRPQDHSWTQSIQKLLRQENIWVSWLD